MGYWRTAPGASEALSGTSAGPALGLAWIHRGNGHWLATLRHGVVWHACATGPPPVPVPVPPVPVVAPPVPVVAPVPVLADAPAPVPPEPEVSLPPPQPAAWRATARAGTRSLLGSPMG